MLPLRPDPYNKVSYMVGVGKRHHTPTTENPDSLACRNLVPLASTSGWWLVDKDFYLVLGVHDSDVWLLPNVFRVSSNL